MLNVRTDKRRTSSQEKCQCLPSDDGRRSGSLVGLHAIDILEPPQPTLYRMEFGVERLGGEFGADKLLCFPHDVCDGNGHPLLPFLEEPFMELVLHRFKLTDQTSPHAQALACEFRLLLQLIDLPASPLEHRPWDLYVKSNFSHRITEHS
jgi:hypothetical protein